MYDKRTFTTHALPLVILVTLLVAPCATATDTLYASAYPYPSPGGLFKLSTATGAATPVGTYGLPANLIMTALAYDPQHKILYGSEKLGDTLYKIDPATGLASVAGNFGAGGPEFMYAMAYDPATSTLFGVGRNCVVTAIACTNDLYRIDPTTGNARFIATVLASPKLGHDEGIYSMGFHPATHTLYAIEAWFDRALPLVYSLIAINPVTGAAAVVGKLSERLDGLAFDPETNIGYAHSDTALHALSLNSGASASIVPISGVTGLGPLQFIPPDSGMILPSNVSIQLGQTVNYLVKLVAPAPSGGVYLTMAISNPAVARLDQLSAYIPSGETQTVLRLTGIRAGAATISASGSGFVPAYQTVQVSAPSTGNSGIVLPEELVVAAGKPVPFPVTLASPAGAGGVLVTLSVSDPGLAVIVPSIVYFPDGSKVPYDQPLLTGLKPGVAVITATSAGFPPAVQTVQVQ